MSELEPEKKDWLYVKDYPQQNNPNDSANEQDVIAGLHQRIASLEKKLDKLIESNKSLIAYFSATHDRDLRDRNYRIRSFASKSQKMPPIGFVPERRKPNYKNPYM